MNRKIILIGNGGHAKVITDMIKRCHDEPIGYLEDFQDNNNIFGLPRLGNVSDCEKYQEYSFIIAIGDNEIRKKIAEKYRLHWATVIDPSAIISSQVEIGEGTCIMPNSVINANSKIGKHCILNTGSIVEHDCKIADYCHLSPKALMCGNAEIGACTWLGAGSTVLQKISLGENIVIGAQACVTKSLSDKGTYVGVPARKA